MFFALKLCPTLLPVMRTENEFRDDLKDSQSASAPLNENQANRRAESLRVDDVENLDLQGDEIPIWENKFVDMIEQMRTIPFVSLGHFEFITVNWIEDTVDESVPILDKAIVEEEERQPTNHWEMVKRMIFSKTAKSMKSGDKPTKEQSIKEKSVSFRRSSKSNYSRQIVDQFNHVYSYFKDFMSNRTNSKQANEKSDSTNVRRERNHKRSRFLRAFKSTKQSIGGRLNRNKLKLKDNSESELDLKRTSKVESYELSKRNRILSRKNLSKISKRLLGKKKEFLLDLSELAASKRFYKLNLIMSKDEGPFMTDYRFLLGIEFWSNYCGVEKNQFLISVCCSNNFWLKEMNLFQSGRTSKEIQQSKSKKEHSKLSELKQFLKGTNTPARAPQRVISSEEKFRYLSVNLMYILT